MMGRGNIRIIGQAIWSQRIQDMGQFEQGCSDAEAITEPRPRWGGRGKTDRPLERRSQKSRHTVLDSSLKKSEPWVWKCSASEAPMLGWEAQEAVGSGPSDDTEGVDSANKRHCSSKKAFVVCPDSCVEEGAHFKLTTCCANQLLVWWPDALCKPGHITQSIAKPCTGLKNLLL